MWILDVWIDFSILYTFCFFITLLVNRKYCLFILILMFISKDENLRKNNKYLLLTRFEGCSVSYRPHFFHLNLHEGHELKRKKQGALIHSMDQENKVSKMFMSLGN